MIRCFYGDSDSLLAPAEIPESTPEDYEPHLLHLVDIYVLADKYDVPMLRELLVECFERIADGPGVWLSLLASSALESITKTAYNNLPEGNELRGVIVRLTAANLPALRSKDSLRTLLEGTPELAADVLLAAGTQSKKRQKTTLHWAAQAGDLDECRRLLDARELDVDVRDGNGETPLHFAAWYGALPVVKLLIDKGADVNAVSQKFSNGSPLVWALDQGHHEIAQVLRRAGAIR
ncbi:Tankyrase-1 [Dactylella cylindrospora]|nr:Tankyrase-1 [Dactylella cylindrospora]